MSKTAAAVGRTSRTRANGRELPNDQEEVLRRLELALRAAAEGDFAHRLPARRKGVVGALEAAYNDLVERYGASADAFELGADHDTYRPRPVERRRDTVVYYARHTTDDGRTGDSASTVPSCRSGRSARNAASARPCAKFW